MKKLVIRENISTKIVQINVYAEDVVILSGKLKPLEQTLQELNNTAQEIGQIINKEKQK